MPFLSARFYNVSVERVKGTLNSAADALSQFLAGIHPGGTLGSSDSHTNTIGAVATVGDTKTGLDIPWLEEQGMAFM